jgi:hypothetical protein
MIIEVVTCRGGPFHAFACVGPTYSSSPLEVTLVCRLVTGQDQQSRNQP